MKVEKNEMQKAKKNLEKLKIFKFHEDDTNINYLNVKLEGHETQKKNHKQKVKHRKILTN